MHGRESQRDFDGNIRRRETTGKNRCVDDKLMTLKMVLKEIQWRFGHESSGSGRKLLAGFCDKSDERTESIKSGEFLDTLRNS
jgi:hypothetical protein